jgi:hypothetical protein
MFYVEHSMKYLIIATFIMFFSSCKEKIANPEKLDEIYLDLVAELDIASKSLEAEEKNMATLISERNLVVPQTGQIKFINKKISDSEAVLTRLKQQKLYFEIKIEQRIHADRQNYEASLKKDGKPYPDKDEISLYKSQVKFHREKLEWDKNKGVKKQVPRGTDQKTESQEKPKE